MSNNKLEKPYLITTASDKKYGDFLIEHWLSSLLANVNLSKTDILILDYGLSRAQRFYLEAHNIIVKTCNKDGHVTSLRFRDLFSFLSENNFSQILICDGGDIIFQDDISHLFEENQDQYRVCCENIEPFFEYFITPEYFFKSDIKKLKEILLLNRTINAGFIIAPRDKMLHLCRNVIEKVKNKSKFGPDQIVVNYVLHNDGFFELPNIYNFIPVTSNIDFYIKDGVFYDSQGKKIPVVHNAGNLSYFRAIDNFGYGKEYNILKKDILITLRAFYTSIRLMKKPQKEILRTFRKIEGYFLRLARENQYNYQLQRKEIKNMLKNLKKVRQP